MYRYLSETGRAAHRQLRALFDSGRRRTYKKSEYILHAHEEPMGVFMLKKGWVKAITIDSDGCEQIGYLHLPGDIFPLQWAIDDSTQDLYYVASGDVELRMISREKFNDYLQQNPQNILPLMRNIVRGEYWFQSHIINLETKDTAKRMAYFFLDLYNRNKSMDNIRHGNSIHISPIYLSHQDIANYLNMARETATKKIHMLRKSKIITLKRCELIIHDLDKLQEEAD